LILIVTLPTTSSSTTCRTIARARRRAGVTSAMCILAADNDPKSRELDRARGVAVGPIRARRHPHRRGEYAGQESLAADATRVAPCSALGPSRSVRSGWTITTTSRPKTSSGRCLLNKVAWPSNSAGRWHPHARGDGRHDGVLREAGAGRMARDHALLQRNLGGSQGSHSMPGSTFSLSGI
jgi:hypothetical protein